MLWGDMDLSHKPKNKNHELFKSFWVKCNEKWFKSLGTFNSLRMLSINIYIYKRQSSGFGINLEITFYQNNNLDT